MAASSLSVLVAVFLLFPRASIASAPKNVVRRERQGTIQLSSSEIQLAASGQMVSQRDNHEANPNVCDRCARLDFIEGVEKTNDCRHANETKVIDEQTCRYAAERAGAFTDTQAVFVITGSARTGNTLHWMQVRPSGCFHMKCVPAGSPAGTAERDCFFYNSGAMDPDTTDPDFAGTPICERHLFEHGTEGTQGGCPSEFKVIDSEFLCETMCHTDDYECAPYFRVGKFNYTRHHDFPKGCFTKTATSAGALPQVYWNSLSSGTDGNVEGIPICVVSAPLAYDGGNGMPGMYSLHNTSKSTLGENNTSF